MLPPLTIPSRGPNMNESGGASSSSPAAASGSRTNTQPTTNTARNTNSNENTPDPSAARSLIWSDRSYIHHGMFAGRHMRFNLEVAQEPINGRRKTEKDRRPLAHCPIVRLRMRECHRIINNVMELQEREEGWEETDVDVSLIEAPSLICAAALVSPNVSPAMTPTQSSTEFRQHSSDPPWAGPSSGPSSSFLGSHPPRRPAPAPWSTHASRSIDGDIGMGVAPRNHPNPNPTPRALQHSPLAYGYARSDSSPNVMRASQDGSNHSPPSVSHETQEDKEQRRQRAWGRNLYGNSHVTGIRVPAPEGGLGIWFLFTDLSVRHEGSYNLFFRCFDMTAISDHSPYPSPDLVTTTSRSFIVYSPRNFPGVPKPTDLAEHFNRLGFKLNTRKNDRMADSTSTSTATPTPATGTPGTTGRPSPQPVHTHAPHLDNHVTAPPPSNTSDCE